jgi:hypothetical protein
MKKTLLMTSALLALTASLALAQGGVNLGWLDCGGLPASLNRTFACNTNSGGGHLLMGSFVAGPELTLVTGQLSVIDLQSAGAAIAGTWWDLKSGGCRGTASLVPNFDFTGGPFTCTDYWQGGAIGGNSFDYVGTNRARIKTQCALPAGDGRIGPIDPGTEVYAWKLTMNNLKTVGLGACAGCQTGVCIVFNSILVTQVPGTPAGNKTYSAMAARNFATWQGGGIDCQITPTHNRTWGSVKSLYR